MPAYPDGRLVRPKTPVANGKRKRWKDSRNQIYEWDYQHESVERYDSRGRHLGQFNPNTGAQEKNADPTRRVEP